MAEAIKVLGQVDVAATTLTALYTVPASTETVVSTLVICNRNSSGVSIRVSVAVAGAADDPSQYIWYDKSVPKNESIFATIGLTFAATDVVRVYSDTANVTFSLFGTEIS